MSWPPWPKDSGPINIGDVPKLKVYEWIYHGFTYHCHGETMCLPWVYHGFTMGLPWQNHGFTMAKTW